MPKMNKNCIQLLPFGFPEWHVLDKHPVISPWGTDNGCMEAVQLLNDFLSGIVLAYGHIGTYCHTSSGWSHRGLSHRTLHQSAHGVVTSRQHDAIYRFFSQSTQSATMVSYLPAEGRRFSKEN